MWVTYELVDVVVPAALVGEALAVVRRHVQDHGLGADREDLCEALAEARFCVARAPTGDVMIEEFTGQNLWDEEDLFDELALAVRDGGVIYAEAEGEYWKVVFKDGEAQKALGLILHDGDLPSAGCRTLNRALEL